MVYSSHTNLYLALCRLNWPSTKRRLKRWRIGWEYMWTPRLQRFGSDFLKAQKMAIDHCLCHYAFITVWDTFITSNSELLCFQLRIIHQIKAKTLLLIYTNSTPWKIWINKYIYIYCARAHFIAPPQTYPISMISNLNTSFQKALSTQTVPSCPQGGAVLLLTGPSGCGK